MLRKLSFCVSIVAGLLSSVTASSAQAPVSVLTRNYNNQRTGSNLAEPLLNASNVNASQFGKLFSLSVDDQIYAGLLYVPSVHIGGSSHNVVYAATVNNSVYAFDADNPGPPLWQTNYNGAGRPSNNKDFGACLAGAYNDFRGNIGIVGTPVIDGSAGTMFFVTRTVQTSGVVQQLHAIDITTGLERANSPKVIQASTSGTGDGGINVVFNPATQNQRPALSLSQGVVYIAWASFCDFQPYHGWVIAYNSASLAQLGAFNATPNGGLGGIWMSGAGPSFDATGNLYFSTGNGSADGAQAFGNSLIKLAPTTLALLDFYTASNYNTLNSGDLDFGSSGPAMLPGTNLLVDGGKEGRLYLLNANSLGHLVAGDVQIPQVFQAVDPTVEPTATHHIHMTGPVWNSPQGLNIYIWGENDYLHGYRFNPTTQTITTTPFATGTILPPWGMPGGVMTLSANGSQSGTGVLWAMTPRNGDASQFTVGGNLSIFNAETLALLWQSTGVGEDTFAIAKGSPPVVANSKVYVASLSRFISVYGLKSTTPPNINLALNKPATGSTPCDSSSGPSQAFNGTYSQGLDDKFCSLLANAFLQVDLGSSMLINRVLIEHAGAGMEALTLNTQAFNIQVSTDGVTWATVANITGNADSITTHDFAPTLARYVQLNVITPTSIGDAASRIYEMQVFSMPDFVLSATPPTVTSGAGTNAIFVATVTPTLTFNSNVTLSLSGLPASATANFSPTSIAGSGTSSLTIATTSATPVGTYPITITAKSGGLVHTATANLIVTAFAQPDFSVAITPTTQLISAGFGASFNATISPVNSFSGTVALAASGLPTGATISFSPPSVAGSGSSAASVVTTAATPAGTYTITIAGSSGALQHSASVTLTVRPASAASPVSVNLASTFNRAGIYTDATTFSTGLDGNGFAYSATLLGSSQTFNNIPFLLGPPNVPNVAINTTVPLPAGRFGSIQLLASGFNGNQLSQIVKVTYTDGSTSSFSQSFGDWASAQPYPGEAKVVTMPYRNVWSGTKNSLLFHVNLYSFALNPARTVSSVTLPTGNVAILAITMVVSQVQVPLSTAYNRSAVYADGVTFSTGGADQNGFAYSANLLGSSQTVNGVVFTLGPASAPNAVVNATATLPAGQYSTLNLLAAGLNGNQAAQTLTINYTDGTTSSFTQSFSDWFTVTAFAGQGVAVSMAYRDFYNGTKDNRTFHTYSYSFALNNTKTVRSVTLPNNSNVVVLAMTLQP